MTSGQPDEKSYDPDDSTLELIDGDDDLDFECDEEDSPRAVMSCGHAVTPKSLTKWCRRLLDQGDCRFVCPALKSNQQKCNVKWPYTEVRRLAALTVEEMQYFEETMARNATNNFKSCPGCKSSVIRKRVSNLNVHCTVCTADRGRRYEFCWQCLKEWKGPAPRSDHCGNDGCIDLELEVLRMCPDTTFSDIEGVTGCPSVRLCPTCGLKIQHNTKGCKNLLCPRCEVEFCFVCLKRTPECLKTSTHYEPCSDGVAPRQTSIPVWNTR